MTVEISYENYVFLVGAAAVVGLTGWAVMSKDSSEAAAWVQAGGSVLAILITMWIARQEDRRRAQVARKSVDWLRTELARVAANHAQAAMHAGNATDQLAFGRAALSELVEFARSVPFGDLDEKAADRLLVLRRLAVVIHAGAEFFHANGSQGGKHWHDKFTAWAAQADAVSA